MSIMLKKQREFFDLADNLYADCVSNYRNLIQYKSQIGSEDLVNELRQTCSLMGLACEYYLKGILITFLKIPTIIENQKLQDIVTELSEEEKYDILIGDEAIFKKLSALHNIKIKELRELQKYSLKSCGHNLKNMLAIFDMESSEDYFVEIPKKLKEEMYQSIKSYYYFYFYDENGKLSEISNSDIMDIITAGNIEDSFVKCRYGHLDLFTLDEFKLVRLMHSLRDCVVKHTNAYTVSNESKNPNTPSDFSNKMIYPDQNSKFYIFDSEGKISRVYALKKISDFFTQSYDFVYNQIHRELNLPDVLKNDDKSDSIIEDKVLENKIAIVPEYGIDEIERVAKEHNPFYGFAPGVNVSGNEKIVYLAKNERQTICFYENGILSSYIECADGKLRKNNPENIRVLSEKIGNYEKENHILENIAFELVDYNYFKKSVLAQYKITCAKAIEMHEIFDETFYQYHTELIKTYIKSLSQKDMFLSSVKAIIDRKIKRKKLLKAYKIILKEEEIKKGGVR